MFTCTKHVSQKHEPYSAILGQKLNLKFMNHFAMFAIFFSHPINKMSKIDA